MNTDDFTYQWFSSKNKKNAECIRAEARMGVTRVCRRERRDSSGMLGKEYKTSDGQEEVWESVHTVVAAASSNVSVLEKGSGSKF